MSSAYGCTPIRDREAGKPDAAVSSAEQATREASGSPAAATGGRTAEDAGSVAERSSGGSGGQPAKSDDKPDAKNDAKPEARPAGPSAGSSAPSEPMSPVTGQERSREPVAPLQSVVAPETADADALKRLSDWSALPVFSASSVREQSCQDRGRGTANDSPVVVPILRDGERDMNNFICKSADADIADSVTDVPYAYDLDRCPETYVRGVELARFEGSGRMARLWISVGEPPADAQVLKNEMLRIYVDDNPRPIVQVRLDQMLTGAAGEVFAVPFGSIAKNSIAWYYPVVFGSKLVVALDYLRSDYYFEIDAALDASQKPRVAPPARLGGRDDAHARLANAAPRTAMSLHGETLTLAAGSAQRVELSGPATVQDLRLRISQDKLSSLSAVRISAQWDGATQPAIDLPLLSLFASGRAPFAGTTLELAASIEGSDQQLSLRLPMPFKSKAVWTLTNTGSAAVSFGLEWAGETKVPSEEFGYLNVQWHDAPLPVTELTLTLAQANTRGRFVGLCADLGGHSETASVGQAFADPLNMVGGDVIVKSDGATAIESLTTDSYVDNGWLFVDSPIVTPFTQSWNRVQSSAERPPGQISFCRWHVLGNEIDFQRELTVTRKVARRDPSIVELHRTVAYLYLP